VVPAATVAVALRGHFLKALRPKTPLIARISSPWRWTLLRSLQR